MALEITDNNYKTIIETDKLSMIDFWGDGYPPCNIVSPIVEQLANEYEGQVVVGKLKVGDNPIASVEFGVRNIPTILFFKGGKQVDKQVGAVPKHVLEAKLKTHI